MDLNEYQMKIKNALLNSQWHKTNIENDVKTGGSMTRKPYPKIPKPVFNNIQPSSYGDNPNNYNETMQMYLKPPNKKRTPVDKKVITTQEYSSDDGFSSSDEDIKGVSGGNFIKSIKKVEKPSSKNAEGGDIKNAFKKAGRQLKKSVVDEAGKTIGREGVKFAGKTLYNGAKSFLTSSAVPALETAAAEAIPVAETAAPLLLAAGVRKRKVTSRHELIKKVMKKKNMTLPQASKYIKDNKLKY